MPTAFDLKLPAIIPEEKFIKMPVREQRVLIAQDILQHIRAERLVPTKGRFLAFRDAKADDLDDDLGLSDARTRRVLKTAACSVCARGAILYASLMRVNSCTIGELRDCYRQDKLEAAFPTMVREKIEVVFEGWDLRTGTNRGMSNNEWRNGRRFFNRFEEPAHRLGAIAVNIIEHGEFKVSKIPSKEAVAAALGIEVAAITSGP